MNQVYPALSILRSMILGMLFYLPSHWVSAQIHAAEPQQDVIEHIRLVVEQSQQSTLIDPLSARESIWTRRMVRGYCSVPQAFRTLQCQGLMPHLFNVHAHL